MRAVNNFAKAKIVKKYIDIFLTEKDTEYLPLDKSFLFGKDAIIYSYKNLDDFFKSTFDAKIANYNSVIKNHPNLNIYFYYIEKDTDINFKTNEKSGFYEYLKQNLNSKNIARFRINNFDEFREYFYKTDHHWNYKGSYKAYRQILKMFKNNDDPLEGKEINLGIRWSGSKATSSIFNHVITEEFTAYKFNFPDMKITMNNKEQKDYGNQEGYFNKTSTQEMAYYRFYGTDGGEIIFDTGNRSKENIMIIGESYDNAILKLLASHYNKVISIDLRNYEHYMNKKFDFDQYIKDYNISKVLFIGNLNFYQMPEFLIQEVN